MVLRRSQKEDLAGPAQATFCLLGELRAREASRLASVDRGQLLVMVRTTPRGICDKPWATQNTQPLPPGCASPHSGAPMW